ncbi:MAG: translation initiation factor IF-3 [Kiritimatiellaeota bacterium]|nr:translation initiation factor IF-3 [Kiritimatiellota bacterium]
MNNNIRVPEVRCLRPDGSQIGVISTGEALRLANDAGLDLVEINPNSAPPVCRIMDYGKFKYEEDRRKKEAKKHQNKVITKEVKFHANVDENDYQVKLRNIRSFLAEGDKVRVSLQFRGRENAHKELGEDVMGRLKEDIKGFGNIEQEPKLMGRTISGLIGPVKQ